jgi:hypothetical protein
MSTSLSRWSAHALASAGVLTVLINAGLTPFMPYGAPFARTASSAIHRLREARTVRHETLFMIFTGPLMVLAVLGAIVWFRRRRRAAAP